MSYNTNPAFTAGICEQILANLADFQSAQNLSETKRSFTGLTDALMSPLNMGGVEAIPIQDGEKRKQVRIKYMQRVPESQVTTTEDGNCTPEQYDDFLEVTKDVTDVVSINWGLSKRELALVCGENNASMIQRGMFARFDSLTRKINSRFLTILSTNFGANYGNSGATTAKSINVLVGSTGAPLATGIQNIYQDYYEKNQYQGTPLIVGSGNISKAMMTTGVAGCCNADGVDMMALANNVGAGFFLDNQIEGILGSNQFAVLAPGMITPYFWHRYVGENAGQFGTSVDTTVTDPRTGLTYDMKVDYDGCAEKVYVRLTLNYGLFIPPTDIFNAEDPIYLTNGSARYTGATT